MPEIQVATVLRADRVELGESSERGFGRPEQEGERDPFSLCDATAKRFWQSEGGGADVEGRERG